MANEWVEIGKKREKNAEDLYSIQLKRIEIAEKKVELEKINKSIEMDNLSENEKNSFIEQKNQIEQFIEKENLQYGKDGIETGKNASERIEIENSVKEYIDAGIMPDKRYEGENLKDTNTFETPDVSEKIDSLNFVSQDVALNSNEYYDQKIEISQMRLESEKMQLAIDEKVNEARKLETELYGNELPPDLREEKIQRKNDLWNEISNDRRNLEARNGKISELQLSLENEKTNDNIDDKINDNIESQDKINNDSVENKEINDNNDITNEVENGDNETNQQIRSDDYQNNNNQYDLNDRQGLNSYSSKNNGLNINAGGDVNIIINGPSGRDEKSFNTENNQLNYGQVREAFNNADRNGKIQMMDSLIQGGYEDFLNQLFNVIIQETMNMIMQYMNNAGLDYNSYVLAQTMYSDLTQGSDQIKENTGFNRDMMTDLKKVNSEIYNDMLDKMAERYENYVEKNMSSKERVVFDKEEKIQIEVPETLSKEPEATNAKHGLEYEDSNKVLSDETKESANSLISNRDEVLNSKGTVDVLNSSKDDVTEKIEPYVEGDRESQEAKESNQQTLDEQRKQAALEEQQLDDERQLGDKSSH